MTTKKLEEVKEEVKPVEVAKPIYQKRVFTIDLITLKYKIKDIGSVIVDVYSLKDGKALIKWNNENYKVPEDFLFEL